MFYTKTKVYTHKRVLNPGTRENNWDSYLEFDYLEFDNERRIANMGSEDFSNQRAKTLRHYLARIPNGKLNKSGGMMTDVVGVFWLGKTGSPSFAAKCLFGENAKAEKI